MELRDLIALLYSAHHNFQSIHLVWNYRYDVAAMQTIQERYTKREPGFSPLVNAVSNQTNPISEIQHQLWWRKPDRWRLEDTVQGHTRVYTRSDGDFWTKSSSDGKVVHHNTDIIRHGFSEVEDLLQYAQLLSPSFLLASHDLHLEGETQFAGRHAIQVRAIYEKYKSSLHEDFFWASADEYRLLVDAKTGILLRYAAVLDGREFAVTSVEAVMFNQSIPNAIFEDSADQQ
jgi:outer membrane lipoprotein-sorting protein